MCQNGEWRSVCDDYWTDVEANVACRQLGFLGYGELDGWQKRFCVQNNEIVSILQNELQVIKLLSHTFTAL